MAQTSMEQEEGVPIAAVEQSTGIARATLRIWERRYGFPRPGRDERGERSYPPEQLHKLRLIADLLAHGYRPGRLVRLDAGELASLAGPLAGPGPAGPGGLTVVDPLLDHLRALDPDAVLDMLQGLVRTMGLLAFVTERMPEMNRNVGLAWSRGELQVCEEHLYSEAAQVVLRNAIAHLRPREEAPRPRVLLATFPEEAHGLGLLMAHTVLALQGCHCTSLGLRVPIAQIATAARSVRADIVGLSFSASMNPSAVLRGLEQLRAELGPEVTVWAGGGSPVLARQRIAGVHSLPHIRDVLPVLAHWRATQAVAA